MNKIPILMYHEIIKPEERRLFKGLTNPAYNTDINVFCKQMAWLSGNSVKTLTIDMLHSNRFKPEEKVICLTFDDGWLGNYLNAYPILKEFGFKATFFVVTDLIGKPFYMNWGHLKEMVANGMSIQSHTVNHPPLARMGVERVLFELSESKRVIEERLGQEVRHLSLPHGIKDEKIWNLAQGIGYKSICTSDVGYQNLKSNGPWLRRINIGKQISEKEFRLIIQGKNRAIWTMKVAKGSKNILKGFIGMDNYRKLYNWVYRI